MHPLTRHDRRSAQRMFGRRRVELGLHPDALDQPTDYAARVAEQARWFESHFGRRALTVRNHGFLNDGYWGHLPAWEQAGLQMSSNIPGLDGNVLNGSLLPARMMLNGRLSSHWSILTTFGDGMVFALGLSDEVAAQKVAACASGIVESKLPGIIVVNLHPQNIGETRRIHGVLRDIVATGFVPWTLSDCWRWFEDCTRHAPPSAWRHRMQSRLRAWAGSRS